MLQMGRRRTKDFHLPPGVIYRRGRFYYGRNQIALGATERDMLRRWSEIRGQELEGGDTFAEAAGLYLRSEEFRDKAASTQREYERQMPTLVKVYGGMRLQDITPAHVKRFLKVYPSKIAGTRIKALLSLVFNFARGEGLTNAPNPCAGIKGKKSQRRVYVRDEELSAVLPHCDQQLRDFLALCYYTGQDAGRVVKWTVMDVRNGELWNERDKTGERVQIASVGTLAEVLDRLSANAIGNAPLLRDGKGRAPTLGALRKRFWTARDKARQTWQIRDLRAKAASDVDSLEDANALLAHADLATTTIYRRKTAGRKAKPVMRRIAGISE